MPPKGSLRSQWKSAFKELETAVEESRHDRVMWWVHFEQLKNDLANASAADQAVHYEAMLKSLESLTNKITEKLDHLNSLDSSGLQPSVVAQRVTGRRPALQELRELKNVSTRCVYLLEQAKLRDGLARLFDTLQVINDAVVAADHQALEGALRRLGQQYEVVVGIIFSDGETSFNRSALMSDEQFESTVRAYLNITAEKLAECYFLSFRDIRADIRGGDRTGFSEMAAECGAMARYMGHKALINRDAAQANASDRFKQIAAGCQIEGLLDKAFAAAKMVDDLEIRSQLEGTAGHFRQRMSTLEACFGNYEGIPNAARDLFAPPGVVETGGDVSALEKRVIFETFVDVHADLAIQFRQFQGCVAAPAAKALFEEMISEAHAVETALNGVLERLGPLPDVTLEARLAVLHKHGLSEMGGLHESASLAKQLEGSSIQDVGSKAAGKKKKKPSVIAPPRVEEEHIAETSGTAQVKQAAETSEATVSESVESREDEPPRRQTEDLRLQIDSLKKRLNEKYEELIEAKKQPDELERVPKKRQRYSPDEAARCPQSAAEKASAVAVLCKKLADCFERAAELRGAAQAESHKNAAKEYATHEAGYRDLANYYKQLGETLRKERIKECLATGPTDKLFRALPDQEIERLDTQRLKHAVLVTDRYGAPLFGEDGELNYDLVVEDKVTLKDGKQFVVHRHFHSPDADATKEQLLQGVGRLVAHTLKTIQEAPLGRAYRESKEHLTLRSSQLRRSAAEEAQERLNRLGTLLTPQKSRSVRR
jgi:hypothetical protein